VTKIVISRYKERQDWIDYAGFSGKALANASTLLSSDRFALDSYGLEGHFRIG
jgi:hypothetical protein